MCTSGSGHVGVRRRVGAAIVLLVLIAVPAGWAVADPDANTCNGVSELNYPTAPNFAAVGDTVRVVLTLGASTIQGGTETTFYVLAVYFGSVGIKRTRHAVGCGLSADLAGAIAAVLVTYLFFG